MGYIDNIYKNNYENNFYITIVDTKIKKNYIYSSCIYNNINYRRQNLILQLLLAIDNIKATNLFLDLISLLVIFYCNKSWLILLNN